MGPIFQPTLASKIASALPVTQVTLGSKAFRRPATLDVIPSVQFLTPVGTGNTGIGGDQMLILQDSEAAKHYYRDGLLTKTRKSKFGWDF